MSSFQKERDSDKKAQQLQFIASLFRQGHVVVCDEQQRFNEEEKRRQKLMKKQADKQVKMLQLQNRIKAYNRMKNEEKQQELKTLLEIELSDSNSFPYQMQNIIIDYCEQLDESERMLAMTNKIHDLVKNISLNIENPNKFIKSKGYKVFEHMVSQLILPSIFNTLSRCQFKNDTNDFRFNDFPQLKLFEDGRIRNGFLYSLHIEFGSLFDIAMPGISNKVLHLLRWTLTKQNVFNIDPKLDLLPGEVVDNDQDTIMPELHQSHIIIKHFVRYQRTKTKLPYESILSFKYPTKKT